MNKNSNTYIFIYSTVMVVLVALALAIVATKLKPKQEANIAIEKQRNILSAIHIESTANNAEELYKKYIIAENVIDFKGNKLEGVNAFTIDIKIEMEKPEANRQLPVYIAKIDDGSNKHILPLYGKGLWGPLWGYIALNDDMNSIYGCFFAHKGETPGLGAEIATHEFQKHFDGKTIFNQNAEFTSIKIVKKGLKSEPEHSVDAISGGTITSKGVEKMIDNCLKMYLNYFSKNK